MMRHALLLAALASWSALAADAVPDTGCALTAEQVAKESGLKVEKRELYQGVYLQPVCKYVMESGYAEFHRVSPQGYSVKTEAELAAKLAEVEKRRLLKDFPVPAYSSSGAVTVVLKNGEVWRVQVMHGPKRGLDPMKLARALIAAKG